MEQKIFAVVVTFNPEVDVHSTQLHALRREFGNILVIDNGSQSSIKSAMAQEWSLERTEVVTLDTNIGLASAQNRGIVEAKKRGASHVVLFDQDSVPDPGFARALLEANATLLARGVRVAAVGPSFYDATKDRPYPATVYVGPFIKRVDVASTGVTEATFIISSGSLISLGVLDTIGLMQDGLFIDFIDVEWCLRAKKMGYGVYVCAGATMRHTVGDNRLNMLGRKISLHSPLRRYYLFRNSLHMLRLPYIPAGYKLREISFNFVRFLVGFLNSEKKKTFLLCSYRGVRDGLRGRFGNYFDFYSN